MPPAVAVHKGYIVALVAVSSALFTGTVIGAVPSKLVPFIARPVARAVAVLALPVNGPVKPVEVSIPVEGLKLSFVDDTF